MPTTFEKTDPGCDNLMRYRDRILVSRRARATDLLVATKALHGKDLPPCDSTRPTVYAVLSHLFVQARWAVRRRDHATVAAALRVLDVPEVLTRDSPLSIESRRCAPLMLDGLVDAAYVLSGPLPPDDPALCDRVGAAIRYAGEAGFGPLVDVATGVVIALGEVPPGQSPVSFTNSFLPATATLQLPGTDAELGELIVHEAAHSWLNECLLADRVVLPTDPPIPSPWKGVPRPPLAILHSAFAFATVVRYLDALQVEPVDGYDTGRAGLERRIIADHLARIDEVLAVVPSAGIRDLVAAQVRLALES